MRRANPAGPFAGPPAVAGEAPGRQVGPRRPVGLGVPSRKRQQNQPMARGTARAREARWRGRQRADGSTEEHKAAVGLNVAWLVALARAFRLGDGRELRLNADIRTAQVKLIQALACADGTPLEELRARFIDPVGRESPVHAEATTLLTDTVRLVERHLACRP